MICRVVLSLVILLVLVPAAMAEERILNYQSDIEVFADGIDAGY